MVKWQIVTARRGASRFLVFYGTTNSYHPTITMPELRKANRVENYTKRWEDDAKDDNETHRQNRLDDYTELVNGWCSSKSKNHALTPGYYDGATELYEYGWGRYL